MKTLVLLAMLQVAAPLPPESPQPVAHECTAEKAFGVKFEDSVDTYAIGPGVGARGAERFVSYPIRTRFRNPKYHHYTVEADLQTREIYSVKAWGSIDSVPPESEYDRLFVPEIRKAAGQFSAVNGISIPTPERPPYSLEHNGIEYVVWHDFSGGKFYYTYECLDKQRELAVQKRALKDMLDEIK